jgi:hypothetical protein
LLGCKKNEKNSIGASRNHIIFIVVKKILKPFEYARRMYPCATRKRMITLQRGVAATVKSSLREACFSGFIGNADMVLLARPLPSNA